MTDKPKEHLKDFTYGELLAFAMDSKANNESREERIVELEVDKMEGFIAKQMVINAQGKRIKELEALLLEAMQALREAERLRGRSRL